MRPPKIKHSPDSNYLMINAVSNYLVRYRVINFTITCLFLVLASLGLKGFGFETDLEFFKETHPLVQTQNEIYENFPNNEVLLLIVSDREKLIISREMTQLLTDLENDLYLIPYVSRVDSLISHVRTWAEEDTLYSEALFDDPTALTPEKLLDIREYFHGEDHYQRNLISSDGTRTMIAASLIPPEQERIEEVNEVLSQVDTIIAKYKATHPNVEILVMGDMALDRVSYESNLDVLNNLLPLTFVLVALCIWFFLRSILLFLAGFCVLIIATEVAAVGMMGWLGWKVDGTSGISLFIIVVVAAADSVHVLTHYAQNIRSGLLKTQALEESLKQNIGPISLTTATTLFGFLGLNFTDSPAVRDLGNYTALGVFFAWLLTLTLLPAIIGILPETNSTKPLQLYALMRSFSRWVILKKNALLVLCAFAVLFFSFFLPKNEMDFNYQNVIHPSNSFRQDMDEVKKYFGIQPPIIYQFDSGRDAGINTPGFLFDIDRFSEWLRTQSEVKVVNSFVDILEELNQKMHGDDPDFHRVSNNEGLNAQYTLLYELSLPSGVDLDRDISFDRSLLKVTVITHSLSNAEMIGFDQKVRLWLQRNTPNLNYKVTGDALIWSYITEEVNIQLLWGALFVLIMITSILVLGLRSLKYGVISLIPNVFPAVVAFGIYGIVVGEVAFMELALLSVSIGLVVDDTVHFLGKYLNAKRAGETAEAAIEYAFTHAGTALVITTVSFVVGLLALLGADWVSYHTVVHLMLPIMVIALILDFLFLPPLLLLIDGDKRPWLKKS